MTFFSDQDHIRKDPPPTVFDASDDARSKREQMERKLLPAFLVEGLDVTEGNSLSERMAYHHVPGVSIAVINKGKLDFAAGYGSTGDEPVTLHTLFQAASVSKPVSAMGALKSVLDEKITLDQNIRSILKSWKIPLDKFPDHPITLRQLLSHIAGFNVGGFDGYTDHSPKTIKAVLEGGESINHEPVKIITEPGKEWHYSGGGYSVMQLLLEELYGKSFEAIMSDMFHKLGMKESSFDLSSLHGAVANGHDKEGKQLDCQYHYYPEKAAAGLWTTPSDLLIFVKEILAGLQGRETKVLSPAIIREMMAEVLPGSNYGLGLVVKKDASGQIISFEHSGDNNGFKMNMLILPGTGQGIIVMTNGDNGMALAAEITRTIARAYNWPQHQPEGKTINRDAPQAYDSYVGNYTLRFGKDLGEEFEVVVTQKDDQTLEIESPYRSLTRIIKTPFYPESSGKFINPMTGLTFTFGVSSETTKIRMEYSDGIGFDGERKAPELTAAIKPKR